MQDTKWIKTVGLQHQDIFILREDIQAMCDNRDEINHTKGIVIVLKGGATIMLHSSVSDDVINDLLS